MSDIEAIAAPSPPQDRGKPINDWGPDEFVTHFRDRQVNADRMDRQVTNKDLTILRTHIKRWLSADLTPAQLLKTIDNFTDHRDFQRARNPVTWFVKMRDKYVPGIGSP